MRSTSMAVPSPADQPEQDVFGANVVMTEATGLFDGLLEHLLRFGREFDLATDVAARARNPFDHLAHAV